MGYLMDIIKNRRSIREFTAQKIAPEIVDRLTEAMLWAPSAGNLQARRFYLVWNDKIKRELAEAAWQDFVATAPLVVVGCTDNIIEKRYGDRGKNIYTICDVACAIQNLLLTAHAEELACAWVSAFDDKKVTKSLNLPTNLQPIALVPIGYSSAKPPAPPRLPKKDLFITVE